MSTLSALRARAHATAAPGQAAGRGASQARACLVLSEQACTFSQCFLNWFQTLSEKAVLHDKLQLKISVFFLFCYFLYQKLCLRFLVWNKVKKTRENKACVNEVDSGSGWLMRPVLFESALKKRLKKQCCSSPFPLSSFGKLLLSFLYYIL